jgi:nucleoside 2-deoxyribosyltransferase
VRVYLASQYPRRNEMREAAKELSNNGIGVTSRWLEETAPLNSQLNDTPMYENLHAAEVDTEDIRRCDTLILFSENPLTGLPRGTHHAEFGYALGLGKRVVVIGGPENVFHFLPQVIHYATLQSFLEAEAIYETTVAD